MEIYMARNPTTRNGLVPLWDQLYSWYFLNFTTDGDKLPYFRAILWHQLLLREQQQQQQLLFKPVPSPIYTIYNNIPSSTPFNYPQSNVIYPLTPPPEYSPPLPSIVDTERSDNEEENCNIVTTTTVINCNRNDCQSSNRTLLARTAENGTENGEVATAVHQNQLNQVRLIYDDFSDNNINTTRSNYFQYMNEYNAINLDNYRNYVREINSTTPGSNRTINNVESNNT